MKILLIEDGRIEQKLIRSALEKSIPETQISIVASVAGAIEILRLAHFDVILCDYYLEDGTACEIYPHITESPLIVITASDDYKVAIEALRAGAFSFILKEPSLTYLKEIPFTAVRAHQYSTRSKLANSLYQAMMSTQDPVLLLDQRAQVTHVNGATAALFQRGPSDFIGRTFSDLSCLSDTSAKFEQWRGTSLVDLYVQTSEKLPNTETLDLRAKFSAIRDDEQRIIGYVLNLRDITQEKRNEKIMLSLQEKLQVAQRHEAFGVVSGGVAHDFNNILASVLGYLELCLEDVPERSLLHRNLLEIQKASQRAQVLVERVLKAGKSDNKDLSLVPLQMAISEVLSLIKVRLPEGVRLCSEFPKELMIVEGDTSDLHQVTLNLCMNAVEAVQKKASPGAEHTVTIKLTTLARNALPEALKFSIRELPGVEKGDVALLEVSDTGTGIRPEDLPRIFDPFFTTKHVKISSGIGLASVKRIVRGIGGTITIDSVVGEGTTARVYLPLASLKSVGLSPSGNALRAVRGGADSILILEDEPDLLDLERQVLERLGYRVLAFTQASEALKIVRKTEERIDLVITDLMMPEISGEEFIEMLRRDRPSIPVLVCTALADRMTQERREELAVLEVLSKPISLPDLALAVRNGLDSAKTKSAE